jgi:UDP-glucose 4-epimerase
MKVLVTGGAGFIGSNVVDLFIENGHDVVIVDDLSTGRRANINSRAKFYEMDIRDPGMREIFASERPEIVDHHAAQIDVRRSVSDPRFDADVNLLGSIQLAELAHEFGVRKFIYISSGGAIYGEPVYLPCDEAHPVQPLAPYGASKYTFELYLYLYKETYGLDYTILRYANVYGPRQDPLGEAGVVAIFTGQMLHNKPVTINGTGIGTTVNQIFKQLKAITGSSLEPAYGPAKAGETFKIYLDSAHVKDELDWEPMVGLEDGLSSTVEYFKNTEL